MSDLSSLVLRLELQSSEPERNNLDVGRAGSAKKRGGGPVKIVALERKERPRRVSRHPSDQDAPQASRL